MKKLNYLILALVFMIGMSFEVKADSAADLACITAAGKNQCVLSGDLVVSEKILVQGDIELDLNGYTIMPEANASDSTGLVMVLRDATLTVKDTSANQTGKIDGGENFWCAVQLTMYGESATGRDATLVVESGTLEGYHAAISGNGNRHNTSITINGGTLIATATSGDSVGIYHPQIGTLVINDGEITGRTGIEMRSGTLVVTGGTITGTATPTSVTSNGNGTTTVGAGIAIAQHTTKKDISVQIKGGTVNGYSAVYESNPQNNGNVTDQVNVSITGGTFNAINGGTVVVYSEDLEDFIVSGTFNKAVNEDYISDIAEMELSGGNYVVAPDNYNAVNGNVGDNVNVEINTTYESSVYTAPVEVYDIDLSWDDLHWVFVYEGDITSPARKVWLSREVYDALNGSMTGLSSNEVNGAILDDVDNLAAPDLNIALTNHSVFAVNVLGSVEEKSNANYTNPAGLQIAVGGENPVYDATANVDALATNGSANLLVKPTATRFVNNAGVSANVAGEVKLVFTKSN